MRLYEMSGYPSLKKKLEGTLSKFFKLEGSSFKKRETFI